MVVKVAINGMGRTGRQFFRACLQDPDHGRLYEVVAINDLADAKTIAYFIKYDSVHGTLAESVTHGDDHVEVDGKKFSTLTVEQPEKLPWKELGVDVVAECTGRFTHRKDAEGHIRAGARKVVISAPSSDADATVVPGVNMGVYDEKRHTVVSAASCTTNCLAPLSKVLIDNFGIKRGFMTTVHAYTNDQRVLDLMHKDLRRSRAASLSVIPTTTGAASAIGLVLPELAGKLQGIALRVPVPDGSLVDLVAELERPSDRDGINQAFRRASEGPLKGILSYTEDPIVSADIVGNRSSCIIDGQETKVIGGTGELVKVLGWYDNEWGYSNRLLDVVKHISADRRPNSGRG